MTLRLAERWLWDFWFAVAGDAVHLFYLQAPRSLGNPDLRHRRATIGHAVSNDLHDWTVLPDALTPGEPGAFDDIATWTGSVVEHDGTWHLLYTGIGRREQGRVQRIGHATSSDLMDWQRQESGQCVEADDRWYEKLGDGWREECWRDPWVFWDGASGCFHMLITARARTGPLDGRGVIGHAWSEDLARWEVGPPVSEPGDFCHLEVPQLVEVGGHWYVLFSVQHHDFSAIRLQRDGAGAMGGVRYLGGPAPLGPYGADGDTVLIADPVGRHYAGRVLELGDRRYFFAWLRFDTESSFIGALSDPMPLSVTDDGLLAVDVAT